MGGQAGAVEPERQTWTDSGRSDSAGIDFATAHPARIWDYYLGGKGNSDADREAGPRVIEQMPAMPVLAGGVRRYQGHAARLLAGRGVRQFLDIGTGMLAAESLHEITQRTAPDSRIVYVDNDPLAVAHSRTLLADAQGAQGSCNYLHEDLRSPRKILAGAAETLDFAKPAAILLLGVLHFISDREDPWHLVSELTAAFTGELYLVLAHGTADFRPKQMVAMQRRYKDDERAAATVTMRQRRAIERFFDGMTMLEGGLIPVSEWLAKAAPDADTPPDLAGYVGTGWRPVR
jgi:hypothetical protein